jgi:hypothetical protein
MSPWRLSVACMAPSKWVPTWSAVSMRDDHLGLEFCA